MTNKDAIDYFKRSYANRTNDDERQHNEALDLAIRALEFIEENYPKTFIDYLNGEQI